MAKVGGKVQFREAAGEGRSAGAGAPGAAAGVAGERAPCDLAAAIAGVARGEARDLARLYEATVGRVYGLALRIVRLPESAEEVAEDVYLQVWRTAARFDAARGAPLTWLLTICRSRALDHLRRADPAESHPEPESLLGEEALARPDDPFDLAAACEGHARLARALRTLSAMQRQLLALAFFRGLTHEEIAAHSGLPLGTVKTRIRRALAALRAELAPVLH